MNDRRTYGDLSKLISFEGFSFARERYRRDELNILQPRLEDLGYHDIEWGPGETDSFGPLTRVCSAKTSTGHTVWFCYG